MRVFGNDSIRKKIKGSKHCVIVRGGALGDCLLTLPLIHALTILHGEQRDELAEIIKDFDDSKFDRLIQLLKIGGSVNYSEILVNNHLDRALELLQDFKESEARDLLKQVVKMVKERNS